MIIKRYLCKTPLQSLIVFAGIFSAAILSTEPNSTADSKASAKVAPLHDQTSLDLKHFISGLDEDGLRQRIDAGVKPTGDDLTFAISKANPKDSTLFGRIEIIKILLKSRVPVSSSHVYHAENNNLKKLLNKYIQKQTPAKRPQSKECWGEPNLTSERQNLTHLMTISAQVQSIGKCNDSGQLRELKSPNRDYFEHLLQRGTTAPLSDFLKHWDPDQAKKRVNSYLDNCADPNNNNKPLKNKNNYIIPECTPDVLYSWGPMKKIEGLEKTMSSSMAEWKGDPNPSAAMGEGLWATISPVSTYTYGHIPVRIKFKKGVKFKLGKYGTWEKLPMTVYVRSDIELNDFIIQNSDVVESWSYGTPEHYDEIVDDLQRLFSKQTKPFTAYTTSDWWNGHKNKPNLKNPLREVTLMENLPAGEETLKLALLDMIRMILNNEGKINYAPGTCKNRERHFITDKVTYFKYRTVDTQKAISDTVRKAAEKNAIEARKRNKSRQENPLPSQTQSGPR